MKPATCKPNNLGHSWQMTPPKCNSAAFLLALPPSRIPSDADGYRDLCVVPHQGGVFSFSRVMSLFTLHSDFLSVFALFEHRRSFVDTLHSDRLRGEIWQANVTRRGTAKIHLYIRTRVCALATKSMAIFSSVTPASRGRKGDIAIFILGRQQTLAIRLADGWIFVKILQQWWVLRQLEIRNSTCNACLNW